MFMQVGFGAVLVVLAMLLLSAFRILREYERGVVFQLGRFWQVKGPGLILLIPVIQQMVGSTCAPWCSMYHRRT